MRLAIELEKRLSKQAILARYLNSAYFGHRAYGIYAAARVFFSKPPRDLTLTEAALLAGLVKAPSAYDPASRDRKAATDRRNYVIDQMAKMGVITPDQAATAKKSRIRLKLSTPPNDCVSVPRSTTTGASSATTSARGGRSSRRSGPTPQEREERLRRGGYKIVTSIDPESSRRPSSTCSTRSGGAAGTRTARW